jgi:hypothetical protein
MEAPLDREVFGVEGKTFGFRFEEVVFWGLIDAILDLGVAVGLAAAGGERAAVLAGGGGLRAEASEAAITCGFGVGEEGGSAADTDSSLTSASSFDLDQKAEA